MIPTSIPALVVREVTVRFRCGHTEVELSASEAEDAEHVRMAMLFPCSGCYFDNIIERQLQEASRKEDGMCIQLEPAAEVTLNQIYQRVAVAFALALEAHFASEEALQKLHDTYFPGVPFDRTQRMNHVLRQEIRKIWVLVGPEVKASPIDYDTLQILGKLATLLDYNIFTQVYLNLNPGPAIRYRCAEAEGDLSTLKAKWASKSPSPFDPKPKMFKLAANAEQAEYNRDLSTIKALSIIGKSTLAPSFRVSPRGATPTLVDSDNLSMLGVGADQYLDVPPGYKAFYFTWEAAPNLLTAGRVQGEFTAPGIPSPFISKSGDTTMLNTVLFSRALTQAVITVCSGHWISVLPRMSSVLVMVPLAGEESLVLSTMDTLYKVLIPIDSCRVTLHEGVRGEQAAIAA